jgi:acetolactate synthase-1/2/3 large subunit
MSRDTSPHPTCAAQVVEALAAHGVDTIFCLPGVQNDGFFNALFDAGEKIRAVHVRHEQAAGYMALGAALATGKPAVYSVVPGPGFLNASSALATAYSTNAPVFCLTGQIPSRFIGRGIGLLHEIPNQLETLKTLTKWAERVSEPAAAARQVGEAFRQLASGRPRPVGLEIPPDVLTAAAPEQRIAPLSADPDPAIDEDRLAEAARLLAGAAQPLILVGGGAQDASAEVRRIAERLQAPVFAYRMGHGVLDSRHPLSLTLPGAHRLWKGCDVLLSVGARAQMRQTSWGSDEALKVIQIDIDPAEMARAPQPAVPLVGRAAAVLGRLAEALERLGPRRPSREEEMRGIKGEVARELEKLQPQMTWIRAIRAALPENGVFLDELTQVGYVSRIAFPAYHPRTFISSGYQGTLGWGLGTALGVKVARPDVPVVSINGDGGFGYAMQELSTAVRHNISVIAIVFSDGAYGNVRRMQQELYGNRVIATDLANPDWVKLGESFGVMSLRARTPDELEGTLRRAIAADRPVLIEVPVGPMPDPWPLIERGKARGKPATGAVY